MRSTLRSLTFGLAATILAGSSWAQQEYLWVIDGTVVGCTPGQLVNLTVTDGNTQNVLLTQTVTTQSGCSFGAALNVPAPWVLLTATTQCNGMSLAMNDSAVFNFFVDTVFTSITFDCGGGQPVDCNGVINGPDMPGTACDDGNPMTSGEVWSPDCECVGTSMNDCQASFTVEQAYVNNVPVAWEINTTNLSTGAEPITYEWWLPDGNLSNAPEPSFTFTQAGVYGICLTITADNGACTSVLCDTIVVDDQGFISTDPVWFDCLGVLWGPDMPGTACTTFLGTAGTWNANCECVANTASCAACFNMTQTAPNTATFTSCSTGGVGPYTYMWDFSGPGGGGVQGDAVEHVFPGIGQYTVCLNITDAEGCMDVLCQEVYVDEEGNLSYDVPNDCQACVAISQTQGAGGLTPWSVDLTSCSSGTAPMLVEWSLPDGSWTNGPSTTYTTNAPGMLLFCATITAGNGCTSTACDSVWFDDNGWAHTNPIYFDCLQIPNGPNVQGTPCSDPATGITGTWNASCECITEPIDCQAGFWVIQAYEGDSLNGIVTPIPYELWVWNLSSGTSPFQFLWSFGDGTTSTDPFPTHIYAESGPYLLCLTMTDAMGCTSTSCDTVSIDGNGLSGGMAPVGGGARAGFTIRVMNQLPTGMDQRRTFTDIRQWPNPVSETLNLRFDTEQRGHLEISVIDMNGRVVLSANTRIAAGTNQVEVATSTLPAGMYTLRLGEGATTLSFRFVKH